MLTKSKTIFGNPMPKKVVRKAAATKRKFLKKYGDDSAAVYSFARRENPVLSAVGTDVLVTKPSELSFYPIPKLFIHRVGGHEAYGALRSSEMGDGTYECETPRETADMIHLMQQDSEVLTMMNEKILKNKLAGLYDGAYNVIKLATRKD